MNRILHVMSWKPARRDALSVRSRPVGKQSRCFELLSSSSAHSFNRDPEQAGGTARAASSLGRACVAMADAALDDFMAGLLDGLTENDLDLPSSPPAVCSQPGPAAGPRPSQPARKALLRELPTNQLVKPSRPADAAPLKCLPQATAQRTRQEPERSSPFPHRSQTSRNATRPPSSSQPSAPAAQHRPPRSGPPPGRAPVVKAPVLRTSGPSKAARVAVPLKAAARERSAFDAEIANLLEGCDPSAFEITEDDFALAPPLAPGPVHPRQQYLRCQVEDDVEEASYAAERKRLEKQILVRATLLPNPHGSAVTRDCIVTLADDWSATRIVRGSTFNILALPPHALPDLQAIRDQLVLSRKDPSLILVLQPDTLVSATTIASASSCLRRSVLQEKIRSQRGDVSEAVVCGNVVHEVVQAMLWRDARANDASPAQSSARDWALNDLLFEARRACQRHLNDLFMLGKSVDEGISMVSAKLQALPAWSRRYVKLGKRQQPVSPSHLWRICELKPGQSSDPPVAITAVLDTEEDVWSPAFGLKGKIDVSVRARLGKSGRAWERDDDGAPMPLEIKTGRNVAAVEHRAQTMLYTLLMSDRYGE